MGFDLSDDEWVLLEPLMPRKSKVRGLTNRKIMNAIFLRDAHRYAAARFAGHPEPQQCQQERLSSQTLLAPTPQNRKLLLPLKEWRLSDRCTIPS